MTDVKTIKLAEILEFLGDEVVSVVGPIKRIVTHPAPIQKAQSESAITFSGRNEIQDTKAGVVICDRSSMDNSKTYIIVRNPRLSFLRLVQAFFAKPRPGGIHPSAIIDPRAKIHPDVYIGPFAYVGECEIDAGTVVYGHVHLYSKTRIGRNVTIHAGTVIGADGFGYERNEAGKLEKFPHLGGVVIEDNVEIGANVCIDRGTLGDTLICEGAKIDNLVHVAHNVVVGRHAAVIAQVMVGGSTRISDYVWIAPSACLRDGISIGRGAKVGMGALVTKDVENETTVMGSPARPAEEFKRILQALKQLAEHYGR